jgi:aryl-alcohol dehydrogenase-like predicted oxidoreductase
MASTFLPVAGKFRVWSHPVNQPLATRPLGRTGREVTTFGLAGGNKVMWDLPGEEGVAIVVKAIRAGVTYLETANNYQLSQLNYGKAFRELNLIPGQPGYDSNLRARLFLATKTSLRTAIARGDAKPVGRGSSGETLAVNELMRALTQFFGDGKGYIPEGAYIDLMQVHTLVEKSDVDAAFEGYENPGDKALPRVGVMAALRDFRDGTNLTGLNPGQKKYIRHIGITGHANPATHMYAMQRDRNNDLETLLVALNPNDKHHFAHQYNSVPVAAAKNMGIIGMKIFADGVLYGLDKKYAHQPGQSVPTVGQAGKVDYKDFLRYVLSINGVSTLITGIGLTDPNDDASRDQLVANLAACQLPNLSAADRKRIEDETAAKHGTDTNFFQHKFQGLQAPEMVTVDRRNSGEGRVRWTTALAGADPIVRYEIWRDGQKAVTLPYEPQTTEAPFEYNDGQAPPFGTASKYFLRTVDASGKHVDSATFDLA